jgi:hypothetical protein
MVPITGRLGPYWMVLSIRRLGTLLDGAEHKKTWYTINGSEQNKTRVLLAGDDCDGVGRVNMCARMG